MLYVPVSIKYWKDPELVLTADKRNVSVQIRPDLDWRACGSVVDRIKRLLK